jgi:uncharacterized tellurite resistance protein B-like protein
MTPEEKIQYIANMVLICTIDGNVSPLETIAIESIRRQLGVSESELNEALAAVSRGNYQISPVGRFSEKVRNLEDMILVSLADGDFAKSEKSELLLFAKTIKITQDQLAEILSESKLRLKSQKMTIHCTACDKEIPSNSKFCPQCGAKV